jgi:hypothetical protein
MFKKHTPFIKYKLLSKAHFSSLFIVYYSSIKQKNLFGQANLNRSL